MVSKVRTGAIDPREQTKPFTKHKDAAQSTQADPRSFIWVATCVIGIYVAFLTQGYIQENIYSTEVLSTGARFKCPLFMVAMVCASSGVMGSLIMMINGQYRLFQALFRSVKTDEERNLIQQGVLTSITYVGAMGCTNFALTKVNFPTQVLVKSAKAVPVVIGSWIMYGKRYPISDYIMVGVVTVSLIIFQGVQMKSGSSDGSSSSLIGFGALCASLTFDGMTGPRQDQLIAKYKLGIGEMMLLINLFATPLCLLVSLALEGLLPWRILGEQFSEFIPKIVLFVVCGALGQVVVVTVLKDLGSLHLTLITTSRKFLAILLSVLYYKHSINFIQWLSIAMLFSTVIFKYLISATGKSSSKKVV